MTHWAFPGLLEASTHGEDCGALVGMSSPWYNHTHSPCHFYYLAPVVSSLCRFTCMNTPAPPEPTPPPVDYDEAHPQGSAGRRLQAVSLLDMTLSYGGAADGQVSVKYLCGAGC